VSYSITREKAPVYTMGSCDARAYSRNKRGIAGTLIWINFDRNALLNLFQNAGGTFCADVDEIRPAYTDVNNGGVVFASSLTRTIGPNIAQTIDQLDTQTITSSGSWKTTSQVFYVDQILPFDITLAAANEYGAMANAKVFGVEILNEGRYRRPVGLNATFGISYRFIDRIQISCLCSST
jgi:hypothetical protein